MLITKILFVSQKGNRMRSFTAIFRRNTGVYPTRNRNSPPKLLMGICSFGFALFTKEFVGINFQQNNKQREQHGSEDEADKTKHADACYYSEYSYQWVNVSQLFIKDKPKKVINKTDYAEAVNKHK